MLLSLYDSGSHTRPLSRQGVIHISYSRGRGGRRTPFSFGLPEWVCGCVHVPAARGLVLSTGMDSMLTSSKMSIIGQNSIRQSWWLWPCSRGPTLQRLKAHLPDVSRSPLSTPCWHAPVGVCTQKQTFAQTPASDGEAAAAYLECDHVPQPGKPLPSAGPAPEAQPLVPTSAVPENALKTSLPIRCTGEERCLVGILGI